MPTLNEFDLTDPTARLVAADALQEQGRDEDAYLLRSLELTGSGETVIESSRSREATARRALELLRAPDWHGFARLWRRSKKIKVKVSRHAFGGADRTEVCVSISWGNWFLAAIRIPGDEPGDKWAGMAVRDALALAGLSLGDPGLVADLKRGK